MRKKPRSSLVLTVLTVGLLRTPGKDLGSGERTTPWGTAFTLRNSDVEVRYFLPICVYLELLPPYRATCMAGLPGQEASVARTQMLGDRSV